MAKKPKESVRYSGWSVVAGQVLVLRNLEPSEVYEQRGILIIDPGGA